MSERNGVDVNRLVSLCESCKHMVPDFPTMEDPLASPFCNKGHWDGCDSSLMTEDPWKDCKDFLSTNEKLSHKRSEDANSG